MGYFKSKSKACGGQPHLVRPDLPLHADSSTPSSEMPGLSCNSCNTEFADDTEQRLHFKSEWHRYNLKRKVAGVPGVTEALFLVRQSAFDQEKNKANETPMLYSCGLCGKGYRSSKAHAQHLNSRSHIMRTSQGLSPQEEETAIVRPLPPRRIQQNKHPRERESDEESEESEWEEVDQEEDLVGDASKSKSEMNIDEVASDEDMDDGDGDEFELDPSCCFMCDKQHKTIDRCMVHMHKHHGFYIPDVEYLKDPTGLLTYLGLKVKRDYLCLYCTDRCHPFNSLEAVRKHMEAKRHCRLHYGDDDEEEEADLEEFYDYSSSYVNEDGKQLVVAGDTGNSVEFGSDGSELTITRTSKDKTSTRTLGSREYLRYYRQKPRPSANNLAITAVLASRYRSMGLATVQSREQIVKMKVMKQINRSGVDVMHSKMGMKSNVIRNLPKNCTY